MEDSPAQKLPQCLWGDGCLLRLTDQRHAETYSHTISLIKKCPIEDCPLYQKAYDFVIGPPIPVTPEIKEAQKHASLHYHPPARSRSVVRTRPPSSTQIPKETHVRRSSDNSSIPKLNLGLISTQESEPSSNPQPRSAPEKKSEPISPFIPAHIKSSSDPSRKHIMVSPKKRSSSLNGGKFDEITKELEIIKNRISQSNASFNWALADIQKDISIIKEILLTEKMLSINPSLGEDTSK